MQLQSCIAAFTAQAALACMAQSLGLPQELAFHPAGFAVAGMVSMTSPLFLAFLPLMLLVRSLTNASLMTHAFLAIIQ